MGFTLPGPVCRFLSYLPIDKGTLAVVCSTPPGVSKPATSGSPPKAARKSKKIASKKKQVVSDGTVQADLIFLYLTCEIKVSRLVDVDDIVSEVLEHADRYRAVEGSTGVPWFVVAVIHNMECSLNFKQHLHNGDPLTSRTTHVPAGRPISGTPPFTWETSAADALSLKNFNSDWSLGAILDKLETYNGLGYRKYHTNVHTPYLWSASNHYTSGKYIADGSFSSSAVSQQIGAAVILKRMEDTGVIPRYLLPEPPLGFQTTAYA